ncbi:hypothetical protein FCM35_KLT12594 [Carex littledalei]|uniref:Uncharacterized protein n=1 Tax=Carex littledalei TaxID=544730 RepID=A0A833VEC8_9POAL|nr:hypothetical protein FCM35_KLT12594 [Carex littledalei]
MGRAVEISLSFQQDLVIFSQIRISTRIKEIRRDQNSDLEDRINLKRRRERERDQAPSKKERREEVAADGGAHTTVEEARWCSTAAVMARVTRRGSGSAWRRSLACSLVQPKKEKREAEIMRER